MDRLKQHFGYRGKVSPTVSPVSLWNCTMTLAGRTSGASFLACFAGGPSGPRTIFGCDGCDCCEGATSHCMFCDPSRYHSAFAPSFIYSAASVSTVRLQFLSLL